MVGRILRSAILSAGGLTLALALSACGGDDNGGSSEVNEQLIAAMVSEGATEEEARCFLKELGDDAERLLNADDDSDLSEEDQEKALEALQKCSAS